MSERALILVCEAPGEGQALAPGDPITGWALSPDGVRSVEIWLDGQMVGTAALDQERPDVAADHAEVPDALHSGFRFSLPALAPPLPRRIELRLDAMDGAGRWIEIARVFEGIPLSLAKLDEKVRIIRESGIFDADFYLAQRPDLSNSPVDPVVHFITVGAAQGRQPNE